MSVCSRLLTKPRRAWGPVVSSLSCEAHRALPARRQGALSNGSIRSLPARARRGFGAEPAVADSPDTLADAAPSAGALRWQTPLRIIKYPDPRLRAVNHRINSFDQTLKKFAADLFEAMYNGDDGVGLAAPQVGVNVRVMVFNETGRRGSDKEMVLVNPKVVSTNKQQEDMEEGCLSFPRLFADVERPTQVKVKAQALDGSKFSLTLTGFPARIFQHEYDHLQGVLFHDRMQQSALESIRPGLVKLENSFKSTHPDTPYQGVQ